MDAWEGSNMQESVLASLIPNPCTATSQIQKIKAFTCFVGFIGGHNAHELFIYYELYNTIPLSAANVVYHGNKLNLTICYIPFKS